MKRITIKDAKEAYRTTGLTPIIGDALKGTGACALGACAVAKIGKTPARMSTGRAIEILSLDEEYGEDFAAGFDIAGGADPDDYIINDHNGTGFLDGSKVGTTIFRGRRP
jgi:hypothetical protein